MIDLQLRSYEEELMDDLTSSGPVIDQPCESWILLTDY